jgi:hypothetical protein
MLGCALLPAQEKPSTVELRVDVIDAFSGSGIEGAMVSLSGIGVDTRRPSDTQGRAVFVIPVGSRVLARAAHRGYLPTYRHVPVANVSQSVQIILPPPARLHGIVVDRETGKPVVDLAVRPHPVVWFRGARNSHPAADESRTDQEGKFAIEALPPGDYVLELGPKVITNGKEAEPDLGYGRRLWPGGGSLADSAPVRILPGSDGSVGVIELTQVPLYRLGVTPRGAPCLPLVYRAELVLENRNSRGPLSPPQKVRCGGRVIFDGLTAGAYTLEISDADNRDVFGFEKVFIGRQDIDLQVDVKEGIAFHGRAVLDGDDKNPLPGKIAVKLWPRPEDPHQLISALARSEVPVQSDGRFSGKTFLSTSRKLGFNAFGLPPAAYVESVKVNGEAFDSQVADVDPSAHELEIELSFSTKSGTLEGTVARDEKDCKCAASVFAVRYPIDSADQYPLNMLALETTDGHFKFTRLQPGSWRVIAVTPPNNEDDDRLERPGVLIGIFSSSRDIDVAKSSSTNLTVPLSAY